MAEKSVRVLKRLKAIFPSHADDLLLTVIRNPDNSDGAHTEEVLIVRCVEQILEGVEAAEQRIREHGGQPAGAAAEGGGTPATNQCGSSSPCSSDSTSILAPSQAENIANNRAAFTKDWVGRLSGKQEQDPQKRKDPTSTSASSSGSTQVLPFSSDALPQTPTSPNDCHSDVEVISLASLDDPATRDSWTEGSNHEGQDLTMTHKDKYDLKAIYVSDQESPTSQHTLSSPNTLSKQFVYVDDEHDEEKGNDNSKTDNQQCPNIDGGPALSDNVVCISDPSQAKTDTNIIDISDIFTMESSFLQMRDMLNVGPGCAAYKSQRSDVLGDILDLNVSGDGMDRKSSTEVKERDEQTKAIENLLDLMSPDMPLSNGDSSPVTMLTDLDNVDLASESRNDLQLPGPVYQKLDPTIHQDSTVSSSSQEKHNMDNGRQLSRLKQSTSVESFQSSSEDRRETSRSSEGHVTQNNESDLPVLKLPSRRFKYKTRHKTGASQNMSPFSLHCVKQPLTEQTDTNQSVSRSALGSDDNRIPDLSEWSNHFELIKMKKGNSEPVATNQSNSKDSRSFGRVSEESPIMNSTSSDNEFFNLRSIQSDSASVTSIRSSPCPPHLPGESGDKSGKMNSCVDNVASTEISATTPGPVGGSPFVQLPALEDEDDTSLQQVTTIFPDVDLTWAVRELKRHKAIHPDDFLQRLCSRMADHGYRRTGFYKGKKKGRGKHRSVNARCSLGEIKIAQRYVDVLSDLADEQQGHKRLSRKRSAVEAMEVEDPVPVKITVVTDGPKASSESAADDKETTVGGTKPVPVIEVSEENSSNKILSQETTMTNGPKAAEESVPKDNETSVETIESVFEIACDKCGEHMSDSDATQCSAGHVLCKTCVENSVKTILSQETKTAINCSVDSCHGEVHLVDAKKVLPSFVVDLLQERREKQDRESISKMTNVVNCPDCGMSVMMDGADKQFHCPNEDCMLACCRYCKHSWNEGSHESCSELTGVPTLETSTNFPVCWAPMPSEMTQDYMKVEVPEASHEYQVIISQFRQTMKKQRILSLTRVQNPKLWQKYGLTRSHILEESGPSKLNELHLFHGTDPIIVDNICREGFDWRLCGQHGTAFGQGSYFAKQASYSHKYSQRQMMRHLHNQQPHALRSNNLLLVARVICGRSTCGRPNMRRPPPDPADPKQRPFNSVVDNTLWPNMYITFDSSQTYPEYVIEYR